MLSRRVRRITWLLLARLIHPRHNPGRAIPDWPKLLHLYSRMRPGTTVFEWMQDHDVRSLGIDVRRFASFGVIKARSIHLSPTCPDLTFSTAGFLTPRTPLADLPRRRGTAHRCQNDSHATSLSHRPAQARHQPDGAPTHVAHFRTPQAAHLRRDLSIRDRKRALDKRHRLAPAARSRGIARYTARACAGPTEQPADRACAPFRRDTCVAVRDHAVISGASSSRASETIALAVVPCNQDPVEWGRGGTCACSGVAILGISGCAGAAPRWRTPRG